jgi:LPS-assembly lipoprotein
VTRLTVAAVLLLALSACGFHPRTHTVLPIKLGPTRVLVADTFSPLGDELARALDRAGVPAADETATDATVLRVTRETWQTRAGAVDPFAPAREYELVNNVEFTLVGPDGKPLLEKQKIEQSREYQFDANASAGSPAEEELIRRELRREMEAAILRRIEYSLRAQP